jgi:hypothetical protein
MLMDLELPRTQASLCKKAAMRLWRVYMKYCSGERRAKGLMGRVHLKRETPGSSWSISCKKARFLASCDISLAVSLFSYFFLLY